MSVAIPLTRRSTEESMQFPGKKLPPLGVVFDSSMGRKIDDVLALGFIFGLTARQEPEVRVISVTISHGDLKAAAFCDAMAWFFTDWKQRELPKRFRRRSRGPLKALPVGLLIENGSPLDAPMITAALSQRDANGEPSYRHTVKRPSDTADVAAVIRNALTAQHDQNAVVVLTGPATNLARLLDLHNIKPLLTKKIRHLVMEASVHLGATSDYNIAHDIPAARKLFAEWPTPIIVVGPETGHALPYPGSSIENDFGWTTRHPVVDAYRAYQEMPYDAPSAAMVAALYAIRPKRGYFHVSKPGRIDILNNGRTRFVPLANGQHSYLAVDSKQKGRIIETYRDVLSSIPAKEETSDYLRKIVEEVIEREVKKQTPGKE